MDAVRRRASLSHAVRHPLLRAWIFPADGRSVALAADARTRQGWTTQWIRRGLVTRGLLLVAVATFLEVPAFLIATSSGPSLGNDPEFAIPGTPERRWVLTVLFALGMSMAVSGLLIRARSAVWAHMAGAAVPATAITTPGPEHVDTLYSLERSVLFISRWSHGLWSQYPLVPWFGIAAMGMLLGRALVHDKARTFRALPWIDVCALAWRYCCARSAASETCGRRVMARGSSSGI